MWNNRERRLDYTPHRVFGILGRDIFPCKGFLLEETPFHNQWNPRQGVVPMPGGSTGRIPNEGPWNPTQGEIPTQAMSSNFGNQLIMPQQMKFPFVVQGHGLYQNPS